MVASLLGDEERIGRHSSRSLLLEISRWDEATRLRRKLSFIRQLVWNHKPEEKHSEKERNPTFRSFSQHPDLRPAVGAERREERERFRIQSGRNRPPVEFCPLVLVRGRGASGASGVRPEALGARVEAVEDGGEKDGRLAAAAPRFSSLPHLHVVGREEAVGPPAHAPPPALVDHLDVGDDVVGVKRDLVIAGWKRRAAVGVRGRRHSKVCRWLQSDQ